MKKKYNPFNRAYDSDYKYDFQDMRLLSRCLLHIEDSTVVEPLSIKDETNFDFIVQRYQAKPLPTFLPIEIVEGAWIAVILYPEMINNPPHKALCYDPLMSELSEVKKKQIRECLQKIPNQIEFISKTEEGIEEADTGVLILQFMSLIKEKKDLNQLEMNGSESTFQHENEKQRQHFGIIYKNLILTPLLNGDKKFSLKENDSKTKIHWGMFSLSSKSEIMKILRPLRPQQFQDITEIPDEGEAENLLKYSIENQDVELAKIALRSGFKVNRGYTTSDFLRVSFLSIIEEEKQKHENVENLQKIQNLLNKYGCHRADSSSHLENFESYSLQRENPQSQSQTEVDRFTKLLKIKLTKTIKNKLCKQSKSIAQIFNSDIAINEIIDEYIKGAIQYASESIQVEMSLKEDKETINRFDNLFQRFVLENQWNQNIFTQSSSIFQSSKITKQDLLKLDKQHPQQSTFILTKLLHYLENAPHSAQLFMKPVWLPVVQNVYELDYSKMTSLILAGSEKIIISFDSKARQDFTTFYDQGFYKVFGNEETEKKSLARILEETICQSFKDAEIFIIGNQFGAIIANEFVHSKFKLYGVKPERVHLSLFSPPGEIVNHFCIPFILNAINANKYFQDYHRHHLERDESIRPRMQDPPMAVVVENIPKKDPEYFIDKFDKVKASENIPIMNGASNGDLRILNLFHERKYPLNQPDRFGQTPLMEAASRGHLPAVEFIIKNSQNAVNFKDKFEQTAIMGAIFYGHREVVVYLRSKEAILDLGQAIKIAAAGGKLELLLDFIQEKNDHFDWDSDFEDFLTIAASRNHENIIAHFIDRQSNNQRLTKYGRKLLFIAVSRGQMKVLEYLLKQGVELSINDFNDYQYLIEAAANGHHDVLQHLLNQTWKSANISSVAKLPFLKIKKGTKFTLEQFIGDNQMPICKPSFYSPENFSTYLSIVTFREKLGDQNQILPTIQDYERAIQKLEAEGWSKFGIITTFVSECIRADLSIDAKYQNDEAKRNQMRREMELYLKQFFESQQDQSPALKILIKYNQVVQLLLGYDAERLNKALEICHPKNQDYEEPEFQVLKAIVYIKKAQSPFHSPQKKDSFLQTADELVNSYFMENTNVAEYWFLRGEIESVRASITQGDISLEAQECFIRAIRLDPFFYQPWTKLLQILLKENQTRLVQEACDALIQGSTIPKEAEVDLLNIYEIVTTQGYLKLRKEKDLEERDFYLALQEAFCIDVKKTLVDLFYVMPVKLKKYGHLLDKKINYSSELLSGFFHKRKIKNESELTHKNHPFFEPIKAVLKILKELKIKSDQTLDLIEDFKGSAARQEKFFLLLNRIISYYEHYIDEVVLRKADEPKVKVLRQCDGMRKTRILSEKNDKFFMKEFFYQEFMTKQQSTEPRQKFGVHEVICYPLKSDHPIFYKKEPYAPGVEFAVASLYAEILPNSTPETLILQLTP